MDKKEAKSIINLILDCKNFRPYGSLIMLVKFQKLFPQHKTLVENLYFKKYEIPCIHDLESYRDKVKRETEEAIERELRWGD